MGPLYVIMCVLFILLCGLLTTVVLLQKKRSAGGVSSISGMGNTDTYWDKNKSRSREGTLEKWTKILALLFFVASFLFGLL